jgi:hypothetical protein
MPKKKISKDDLENRIKEFEKCSKDPVYFITKHIKIPEVGGSVKFKLYNKQIELVNNIMTEHYMAILKTRQTGASTVIQAFLVWLGTFFENVVVGVISRDGPECTDFARKTMDMIDELPDWMRPKYVKKTEQSFILKTGFKLFASTVNPAKPQNTLRGKSITFLVIDEAAFIGYIDDAYTGMAPALFKAQSVAKEKGLPYGTVVISTPNGTTGIGEWYYNLIKKAKSGESIFKYFEMHWRQIPEFANNPNWYSEQCKLLDNNKRKIAQELDMTFLGSRDCVFDDDIVGVLQESSIQPIMKKRIISGDLWIWEEYNKQNRYLIGVDTATREGACFSTIQVIKFETLEQVAEYQGSPEVTDFSKMVKLVMDIYPNCFCVIEVNSYGNQVVETLKRDIKYADRMYKRPVRDKKGIVTDYKYGLQTDNMTRPLIMESLLTYVNEYPYIVKSSRLALELISLEDKNGKIKGRERDDLVLAFAFCLYVIKFRLSAFTDYEPMPDEYRQNFEEILKFEDSKSDNILDVKDLFSIENDDDFSEVWDDLAKDPSLIYKNHMRKIRGE